MVHVMFSKCRRAKGIPFGAMLVRNLMESSRKHGVDGSLKGNVSPLRVVSGCNTSTLELALVAKGTPNGSVHFCGRHIRTDHGFTGGM